MWFAIIFTCGQLFLSLLLTGWGLESLVCYLICMGIGFLLLKKDTAKASEILPFNVGLKPVTALLVVALAFLMVPLSTLLSEVGGKLGGDMLQLAELGLEKKQMSVLEFLFELAVIPAVFEELFFRGFFYAGFKRARGARFAILLSSVLFGFFHMNVQQVMYAVVLGILLAVLRELTGSMWAGCLYHFVNNGWSAVIMLINDSTPENSFLRKLPLEQIHFLENASGKPSTGILVYSIAMVLVCTAVAVFIVRVIAKREGRIEDLKRFFKKDDDPKGRVVTAPFIVGCVIYGVMTLFLSFAVKLVPAGLLGKNIQNQGN